MLDETQGKVDSQKEIAEGFLTVTGKATEKNEIFRLLTLSVTIRNADGDKVCRGIMKVGLLHEDQ